MVIMKKILLLLILLPCFAAVNCFASSPEGDKGTEGQLFGFEKMSRFPEKVKKQTSPSPSEPKRIATKKLQSQFSSSAEKQPQPVVSGEKAAPSSMAQAIEEEYRRQLSQSSVPVLELETQNDAPTTVNMEVVDKTAVNEVVRPQISSEPLPQSNANETVSYLASETCDPELPEEIEPLKPYIVSAKDNHNQRDVFEDEELIESMKLKMQLLEREKEALRKRQPEDPSALSVVRVCTEERMDVQALVKRLEKLETENMEFQKIQENLSSQNDTSAELDMLKSKIDELAVENQFLQGTMEEMRSYIDQLSAEEKETPSKDIAEDMSLDEVNVEDHLQQDEGPLDEMLFSDTESENNDILLQEEFDVDATGSQDALQ